MHKTRFWKCSFLVLLATPLIAVATLGNRELARATTDRIIESNAGFCRKFGLNPASTAFLTCMQELQELMRQHDQIRTSSGQF